MSCKEFSDTPDWARAIEQMVHEAVSFFRGRGHKQEFALEQTSLALGLSARKAKSFYYREPYTASGPHDYATIRERFARHLEHQAEDYARRSDQVRARLRQMEMDL